MPGARAKRDIGEDDTVAPGAGEAGGGLGEAFAQTILQQVGAAADCPAPGFGVPTGGARYVTEGVVGEGGMGRVLRVNDRQFGRLVALKELRPGLASAALEARFAVESLVTANLEHPGIAPVYERGVGEGGAPFYAMRLVQGATLTEAMKSAGTMRDRLKLLPVLLRTAQTLAFAHEHGVVHRDVKPDNILVGRHGETILLDWGIARVRGLPAGEPDARPVAPESKQTQHGSILGTPAYMAPEQATGSIHRIDERTDVFALGALLYHLLAGRPPHEGSTSAELVTKAASATPPPLSELAPDAPLSLRAIAERAMARAPEDRYQTATEMAEALEAFTADAVAGRKTSAVGVFASASTALGVVVLAIATVLTWVMFPTTVTANPMSSFFGLLTVFGLLCSILEWRTHGRHALSPLAGAFAGATVLWGLALTMAGLASSLGLAGKEEVFADPVRHNRVLTLGPQEAIGVLAFAAVLGALQLLVRAAAARHVLLFERSSRQG